MELIAHIFMKQRKIVWDKEAHIRSHAAFIIKWWLNNVPVNIPMDKLGLDVSASTANVSSSDHISNSF